MESTKTKILYIAGMTRSGSTILGNLLGEVSGCFTVGEPIYAWGEDQSRLCGCGEVFTDCPVWNSILNEAFGDAKDQALAIFQKTKRSTHVFGNFYSLNLFLGRNPKLSDEYVATLAKFYHSIQKVTGARIIIDESKVAAYALALSTNPNLEVWILHLVRDPRAVAFSWKRKKSRSDQDHLVMPQFSPLLVARRWLVENFATHFFFGRSKRYYFLRYEDLLLWPQKYFDEILSWMGIPKDPDPFIEAQTVLIRKDHHLMVSNPVGFLKGKIELKMDDEWSRKMNMGDKLLVTACTWPMLLAYRYPL